MAVITPEKLSVRAEKLFIILDWGFAYARKVISRKKEYDQIVVQDVWLKDMKACHKRSLDDLLFNDQQITFTATEDDLVFRVWR